MFSSAIRPLAGTAALVAAAACGGVPPAPGAGRGPIAITLDGSSTVFPISEAVAEEFQKVHAGARVTVGISGTGGGFQKFCRGEIDANGASRPIQAIESAACARAGVEFIELPIAYDGIAVVVNPAATWIDHLTVAELKTLWAPEAQGTVLRWSQIRRGWPDREIHLFGAGVHSGTYDYFTRAIVGTEGASRGDFTASEDDNLLVRGIGGDALALGFLPFAYFQENRQHLKLVPIDDGRADNGAGPIAPSLETIRGGTYQPLSRPIFLYVAARALARPEVARFVEFYLRDGGPLAEEVGYARLGDAGRVIAGHLAARRTGTVFARGGSQIGVTADRLLARERFQ